MTIATESHAPLWPARLFAVLLGLFWIPLAVGGARLLQLGGSPYYVVAAVVFFISAVLVWRGDRRGAWLYWAGLVATAIWAVWEAGLDGWALMPRLLIPAVFGLWLLLPWTRRALARP